MCGETIVRWIYCEIQPSPSKYPLIKCLIKVLSLKIFSLGNTNFNDFLGTHPYEFKIVQKCLLLKQQDIEFFL